MAVVDPGVMLSEEQVVELRAVVNNREVPAAVATRARIVLWMAEGRRRKDVAEMAGVSLPTVHRWVDRYADEGLAGLDERKRGGPREQVPAWVPARILGLGPARRPRPGCRTGPAARGLPNSSAPRVCRCPGPMWRSCGGTTICGRTGRAR